MNYLEAGDFYFKKRKINYMIQEFSNPSNLSDSGNIILSFLEEKSKPSGLSFCKESLKTFELTFPFVR